MPRQFSYTIALAASIAITGSCSTASDATFTINSQPINPLCLAISDDFFPTFTPYLDQPDNQNINNILNLNACQASITKGRFITNPKYPDLGCPPSLRKGSKQFASYDFPWGLNDDFNMTLRRGCLSYEYIGKSQSGIDVLHIRSFGGGTGQFSDIMLVKRIPMKRYNFNEKLGYQWDKENFIGLLNVGKIPGGDRNTGSFLEINLNGNRLTGMRYSPKNDINAEMNTETFDFQLP